MENRDDDSHIENLTKKERKISRNKNIILDGASELFLKFNYQNVTMSDIADSVALSRATLYNYFGTKEEIYFGIGLRYAKELTNKMKKLFDSRKTGLEGLLSLYKFIFEGLLEIPLIPQIVENLYKNLIEFNLFNSFISAAVLEDESTEIQAKIDTLDIHIMDFTKAFINYRKVLNAEFRRGKEDGSIQSNLDEIGFFSLMNILYLGSGSFFRNFQFPTNQNGMTGKQVIELILKITESQLTDLT